MWFSSPITSAPPCWHGRVPVVSMVHDCVFERDAAASGRRPSRWRTAPRPGSPSVPPTCWRLPRRPGTISAVFMGSSSRPTRSCRTVWAPSSSRCRAPPAFRPRLPDRYILHVGVQRPHKNQRVLVEALSALRAEHPGLGLVLVGQPDPEFPDEVGKFAATLGVSDLVHRYAQRRRTGCCSTCTRTRPCSPSRRWSRVSGCRSSRPWRPGSRGGERCRGGPGGRGRRFAHRARPGARRLDQGA